MYDGLLLGFILFGASGRKSLPPNFVARNISDRLPVSANHLPIVTSPVRGRT